MPKQMKPMKKGQKVDSNPKIKIAKPEMTLTGFEHSKKTILKKERLIIKAKKTEQIEVVSRSNRSKSSRKSSLRASSKNIDDSDEEDGSENASDISHPPMNEDIESLNHNEQDSNEN